MYVCMYAIVWIKLIITTSMNVQQFKINYTAKLLNSYVLKFQIILEEIITATI